MTEVIKEAPGLGRGGRMSRQRKRTAVLRLLRGGDLELVSREARPRSCARRRATAVPSGSSARSRRTCSGCGTSRRSRNSVWRCWSSGVL